MLRRTLLAFGLLVVIVGIWLVKLLYDAGVWRTIEPHFAGRCRLVPGPVGPEDLTIHPKTGVAYISSTDRRALQSGAPKPGGLWAYRLADPAATPVNLTPGAGIDFQPHGISLWVGEDGRDLLFVVNHPAAASHQPRHTIEIFEVRAESLEHLRSLSDPDLLVTPNDIVAVSADHFYVTNTHAHLPGVMQTLETYLRLERARVVYFDGSKFRVALEGLLFPNGINTSTDGTRLWVASSTAGAVQEYERDPATESLRPLRRLPAPSGLDNIEVDAAGDLWIGAHPKLLAVNRLLTDPTTLSPSQGLHVNSKTGAVEEIYLNDGTPISGSSVAIRRDERLLIGQIIGAGILDCTLDQPAQ